ncbi:MAG: hypothetical protein DI536_09515 [Archangium gephyra]|uniref:Uncharacterized protein n=1 Tax=Archangium gephyra TaxID=48 RepID=A0A2W5TUI6_9BACT|nr:MAG: hypothetical protein DI536_09515 [Archangium gephyra]
MNDVATGSFCSLRQMRPVVKNAAPPPSSVKHTPAGAHARDTGFGSTGGGSALNARLRVRASNILPAES